MRKARWAMAALVLAIACLALAPSVSAAKQRPLYWGAWIGKQLTGQEPPWDMSAVSRFEGLVHKGLSLVEFSSPFADCDRSPCSSFPFPTAQMQSVRNYGAIPFFSWGSASSSGAVEDRDFQLADLTSGRYDSNIRQFAEASRDWGHPYFLRFDWEMNGDWFPWSEAVNRNKPGQYVAAWRHVHDIFTSVGATNATWVWCPYSDIQQKLAPMRRFYPGGAYVDWTCLDGFNWGKNAVNPQPWRSFDQLFRGPYTEVVKKIAPGKPMILAEMASAGSGRAKSAWIDDMFKQIATRYRQIRGLIWFDQVDRGVQWPLETSAAATQAFSRGLKTHPYRSNLYWELSGSPIPPPG